VEIFRLEARLYQGFSHLKTGRVIYYHSRPRFGGEKFHILRIGGYSVSQEIFEIYQIRDGAETRDYRFEPLERLKAAGHSVERGNYEQVCAGTFERGNAATTETLNALFEQFNTSLPADYRGRSVSVSDVVVLRDAENAAAYYVDSFGFAEVPEFLTEAQDRTAEQSVYKYYSTQRPIDIGTFPKGENAPVRIVNFDKREAVESGLFQAWGSLEYSAPLTDKQMSDYELKAALSNRDVKERMDEQAQIVGAWEEKRKAPENMRLTWWYPDFGSFVPKEYVTPEQMAERYNLAVTPRNKPRPIAEQLAEGAERAAKDNAARTSTGKSTHKKENRE
jgi:hypothetical protein